MNGKKGFITTSLRLEFLGQADDVKAAIFMSIVIAFVGNIGTIIAALREMYRSQ